jgi:transketolase
MMGKIPFIASYAMFSPGRSWEQVRTTIAYNESNVKIIGAHAGISVGPDGATHQAIEDIALMRIIPTMVVISPCDVHEARKAVHAAVAHQGPVYIRIAREKTPVVTTVGSPFAIGKAEVFYRRHEAHQKKVGIIATGTLLYNALHAAKQLNDAGIGASVMNMATIKPLDTEALEAFAHEHGALVTVEEHQVAGGLGGAISEYVSEHCPMRVVKVGVQDQFGQSGTMDELLTHYGMDIPAIVAAGKRAVA